MSNIQHTSGFTIVEITIVIIVIGILASITLVAYNGSQQQAATAQVKSDIKTATSQLESYRNFNTGYPTSQAAAQAANTLNASSGITLSYTYIAATKDFCVSASSSRSGVSVYKFSSATGILATGTC